MDPHQRLRNGVSLVRRRLTARTLIAGVTTGLLVGLALALPAVFALGQVVLGPARLPAQLAVVFVLAVACTAFGVLVSVLQRGLHQEEAAQVLDRALGAEESWLTLSWLLQQPLSRETDAHIQRLSASLEDPHAVAKTLPVRLPRRARWIPVLLGLVVLLLLLPPHLLIDLRRTDDPVQQEAERLAKRLAELDDQSKGAELPNGIEVGVQELADDLGDGTLDQQQAIERLEELQKQLEAYKEQLAGSDQLLDQLEKAADALSQQPDLADALRDADLEQAAKALDDLAKKAPDLSSQEKQALGEQMQKAGEGLSSSSDPSLKNTGDAMQRAGEALQEPEPGDSSTAGTPSQANNEGSSSQAAEQKKRMDELRETIQKNQELGERLQQDQKALQRAQETQGALEASKQRLGGEPDTPEGSSSQTAGNDPSETGEGPSSGESRGRTQGGTSEGEGSIAKGDSPRHTWEDEGESGTRQEGEFSDSDRTSDRKGSAAQHLDDFERLYAPSRLRDVDALLAGTKGTLDENGEIELVPTLRTGSDERGSKPLLNAPDSYTRAAREAIHEEAVPAGYRDAVKQYFDQVE